MFREPKQSMMTTFQQIQNINKEIKIIKKEQNGNSRVENIMIEMKNSVQGLNIFELAEEKEINEFEDRSTEILYSEEQRKK